MAKPDVSLFEEKTFRPLRSIAAQLQAESQRYHVAAQKVLALVERPQKGRRSARQLSAAISEAQRALSEIQYDLGTASAPHHAVSRARQSGGRSVTPPVSPPAPPAPPVAAPAVTPAIPQRTKGIPLLARSILRKILMHRGNKPLPKSMEAVMELMYGQGWRTHIVRLAVKGQYGLVDIVVGDDIADKQASVICRDLRSALVCLTSDAPVSRDAASLREVVRSMGEGNFIKLLRQWGVVLPSGRNKAS